MNLHIMQDEKVISRTIDYFNEALPGQNVYIILIPRVDYKCIHVKNECGNIYKVVYGTKLFWQAVGDVAQYKFIILHYLDNNKIRFTRRICHPGIVWIIWGADLYFRLLRPKGYRLFYDENIIKKTIQSDYSPIKRMLANLKQRYIYRRTFKAAQKVRYLVGLQGDYDLLVKYYPYFRKIERRDFFYYPLDEIIPNALLGKQDLKLGNDIIVGNSGSIYGNHEEIFLQLSKIKTNERKVKVPLSYGASSVVKYVIEKGELLLGDRFVPILDFMPLDDYNKFLCSARTYIYGNYRQEAEGNIVVALYVGGAVFLHPSNVLLKEYRDMGCICFSTEELAEKINYHLTDDEKKTNMDIMRKHYNVHRLLNIIRTEFASN